MAAPDPAAPSPNPKPWRPYRSKHRQRSHDEAHADTSEADHATLDHPLVPAGDPHLVTTQPQLDALIAKIRAQGRFGYDSEFIGEESYFPRLCMIQISVTAEIHLIDPFQPLDLMPFWRLLIDPEIEKIVHAGVPDLEPAYRHTGEPAQNVFDAQIAAGFTGLPFPMGLSKLVMELAGVDLAQGSKFSQWDKRPLTSKQMRYAANDVRYLLLLRSVLGERLEANQTTHWASEEFQTLSDPSLYRFDAESQRLRVRGAESLRSKQTAVLRALLAWRETAAKEQDVPPRSLLRDEIVLAMARHPAATLADLDLVRGLPRPVEERYGQVIIDATAAALEAPIPKHNGVKRRHFDRDAYKLPIDALFALIGEHCVARKIDPALVASRKDVTRHIQSIVSPGEPDESGLLTGWRRELLGDVIAAWRASQTLLPGR